MQQLLKQKIISNAIVFFLHLTLVLIKTDIIMKKILLFIAAMGSSTASVQSQTLLTQNFDISPPASWSVLNLSNPVGTSGWFQGNPAFLESQAGATNSYMGANFNNVVGNNIISNWIFTPTVSLKNGDVVSFYTKVSGPVEYADRHSYWFACCNRL